ncbi:uncharacterized protein BJX67DRAFT_54748 [Aspergillus lucknowensis]|uniref:Uncharacterized protein n=1 Tax=Aspergillus lucknowensis TaxID=176173 RepID=A0ABR4LV13_9EURO
MGLYIASVFSPFQPSDAPVSDIRLCTSRPPPRTALFDSYFSRSLLLFTSSNSSLFFVSTTVYIIFTFVSIAHTLGARNLKHLYWEKWIGRLFHCTSLAVHRWSFQFLHLTNLALAYRKRGRMDLSSLLAGLSNRSSGTSADYPGVCYPPWLHCFLTFTG